jgi:membrane-bound serine protease (ClpP class)
VEAILLNPNVAYLLVAAGVLLAVIALLTPGTGVAEVGAVFTLLLGGWGIYNNPINLWALILLVISPLPFLLSLRRVNRGLASGVLLGAAILSQTLGSAYLFRGPQWWQPGVYPLLAVAVSALSAGFFWYAARRTLELERRRPAHDLNGLIGAAGQAKSAIHEDGSVQVAGELWSARSAAPITAGSAVRVTGREGFILDVELDRNGSAPAGPAN